MLATLSQKYIGITAQHITAFKEKIVWKKQQQ